MIRNLLILSLGVLLCSCNNDQHPVSKPDFSVTKKTYKLKQISDDSLEIIYSDDVKDYIISEGHLYQFEISPDGKYLACNSKLFSNLDVTMLYQSDSSGQLDIDHPINLSRLAWDSLAKKEKIDPRNLINTKSSIIGWDNNLPLVRLSALHDEKGAMLDSLLLEVR